jgi:hypothetical protein
MWKSFFGVKGKSQSRNRRMGNDIGATGRTPVAPNMAMIPLWLFKTDEDSSFSPSAQVSSLGVGMKKAGIALNDLFRPVEFDPWVLEVGRLNGAPTLHEAVMQWELRQPTGPGAVARAMRDSVIWRMWDHLHVNPPYPPPYHAI